MAEKTFYHSSVGVWVAITEPSQEILSTYPEGTVEIPKQPSVLHTWTGSSWKAPTTAAIREKQASLARARRHSTLQYQVDPVVGNPLRWNSLTQEERDEISAYRTALLDITNDPGWPQNITWPTKPSALPEVFTTIDEKNYNQ